jgi:hypothetical protein
LDGFELGDFLLGDEGRVLGQFVVHLLIAKVGIYEVD